MKWFKHVSDSLDDPFVYDLVKRFGADGYLVFFGTLEVYAREFKPKHDWKLIVTKSYLSSKLHKRQSTLVLKILKVIKNSRKWEIEIIDNQVSIYIPKFLKMLDDTTLRKLRRHYEQTLKNPFADQDQDVDEDKEDKNLSEQAPTKSQKFEAKTGELSDQIIAACEALVSKQNGSDAFNPFMWVQVQSNLSKHPRAILESLTRLSKYWDRARNPWTYASTIVNKESGNYYETEHAIESEGFNQQWETAIQDTRVADLIAQIGNGQKSNESD